MNGPGPAPWVPMPVAPMSAEARRFLEMLLASARLPAAALEPPAQSWMQAYRVRRCGCGTAVAAESRCRSCWGPR